MSETFEALKDKISNADPEQAKELLGQVKQAYEDKEINEEEKDELMNSAKSIMGDSGLGGLF